MKLRHAVWVVSAVALGVMTSAGAQEEAASSSTPQVYDELRVRGNVGIGLTNPGAKLEISGGGFRVNNADTGALSYGDRGKGEGLDITSFTHPATHGTWIPLNLMGRTSAGKFRNISFLIDDAGNTGLNFAGGSGTLQFGPAGTTSLLTLGTTGGDIRISPGLSSAGGMGNILLDVERGGYRGEVVVEGDFRVTGAKAALVPTDHFGPRSLYSFEQATARFADEGMGELRDGAARIDLDPIFLETIEPPFFVHLTPYGNSQVYVDAIGDDHFIVRSTDGSRESRFFWMLTAPRKGYAAVRLETDRR